MPDVSIFAKSQESAPKRGRRSGAVRFLRGLGRVLLFAVTALLVLALLGAGAVAYLTGTESGRDATARQLERSLSRALPGTVAIGELDRLALDSAVVRELRFFAPDGALVLRAARAELEFDPLDFTRGVIRLRRARIDGGELVVAVQPDGRTGIEAAFDDKGPGQGEPARIDLGNLHVEKLGLVLRPAPDQTFRLRDVQGFVRVTQQPGMPGVQVQLDGVRARVVEPEILGERVDILRAEGFVHGGARQILRLELDAELGDDRFDATLGFYQRERKPVVLELEPLEGLKTQLAALGAEIRSWGADKLDVRVR